MRGKDNKRIIEGKYDQITLYEYMKTTTIKYKVIFKKEKEKYMTLLSQCEILIPSARNRSPGRITLEKCLNSVNTLVLWVAWIK